MCSVLRVKKPVAPHTNTLLALLRFWSRRLPAGFVAQLTLSQEGRQGEGHSPGGIRRYSDHRHLVTRAEPGQALSSPNCSHFHPHAGERQFMGNSSERMKAKR